ncbi:MAG: helicase-related protein [Sphaerochaetaceae bacterium]
MFTMKHLPVYRHRKEILDALKERQVVVVESPTGSGKTTQIPLILHEAGYTDEKIVGITQPRRIATLSVCDFIKRQIDDTDSFVGYKMRFNDTSTKDTKIKVMTDGILLMELKADPLLSKYSVILVDEAHERSLNIDFVLGLLYQILQKRPEFKVIVSSATINTSVFSRFFFDAPIIHIDARIHPVDIHYQPVTDTRDRDAIFDHIQNIVSSSIEKRRGDILIFLPGEADIKKCLSMLSLSTKPDEVVLYPLYGRLSKEEQERVFIPTPEGKTKIVISTNIAETSLTIDGIRVVIDSGIAKMNYYNQKDFTSSLITLPVSRASCQQRAGRAGRTAPGECFRLYSEHDFSMRDRFGSEEILRTDLSEVVLRMSELGIYDYQSFPFLTKPKERALQSAKQTLRFIGAIDDQHHLTPIGNHMVRFPLSPRHSRVIVEAMLNYPNVLEEVLIAISFLSCKTPFILPAGKIDEARAAHQSFQSDKGDFISYLTIFYTFTSQKSPKDKENFCKRNYLDLPSMNEIVHVRQQLGEIISSLQIPISKGGPLKDFMCCLASGLLQFVCMRDRGNMYHSVTAQKIFIHPGSSWFKELPQYLLAGEIVMTSKMYARTVSPLKKEWLDIISPELRGQLHSSGGQRKGKDQGRLKQTKEKERVDVPTVRILGTNYPSVSSKKGKRKVAVIPLQEARTLFSTVIARKSKIQTVPAALMYQGSLIQFGDSLFNVVTASRLIDTSKGVLPSVPKGGFSSYEPKALCDNLDWILALTRVKKSSKYLSFTQLDTKGNGYYLFSANADAFDALDTSLYALGQLVDEILKESYPNESKIAMRKYKELLKLFDL